MKRQRFNHAIIFGDGTLVNGKFTGLNTYNDFHLVPSSRPTISAPGVETKFVTIPGRDGSIDLSEFLRNGRPAYGNRSGSFDFNVENSWDDGITQEEFWMTIYPKLFNNLHGKRFKMVLVEDDPDHYWEGRFTVDKYEPGDGAHSQVSISYAVDPFKRNIRKNSQGMVWDNFNFEADHDHAPMNLNNVTITGAWTKNIWGDGYSFPLEVTAISGGITVTFGGETKTITSGQTANIGHAEYGWNTVTVNPSSTTATFKLDWRGGSL